jgi:predicted Zn finger-like uncharacterized protein
MTTFKVVPDQLRISEGWVRCGQCDEVFDATANMQEPLIDHEVPKPTQVLEMTEALAPAAPMKVVDRSDQAHRIEPMFEPVTSTLTSADSSLHTRRSSDETIVGESFIQELAQGDAPHPTKPVEAPHPPSFMRSVSLKRKPWVTASLVFSALLLGAGLIFQVLLHERDRIAVVAPELKPVLVALCELTQCAVAPLRQIESVVIDSSAFNKLRGDVYRLNFTLKNTAQIALAMPSIELSLTDAQDQALMRRVLHADDLGSKSDSLMPTSEFSASLTLTVKSPDGADRVAGYRVLAFYP